MKFRDLALTMFWRPPPNMEGVKNFASAGFIVGLVAGVCLQGEHHRWLFFATGLLGDLAGAGIYVALRSAGLLDRDPPKERG
jgi:hypothetical protein